MIKILVVDDHTIFRQCIVSQIRIHHEYEVVAETGSGAAAVRFAETLNPDIIIMDISLPDINGIEAVKRIKEKKVESKIILLSMYKYPELLDHLKDLKIEGYILKNDTFESLLYAIKAVHEGKNFISSSLLEEGKIDEKNIFLDENHLTRREVEIISLIAEGFSSKEIAKRLSISMKTVETHRTRIIKKLNVKNVAELVKKAISLGIIRI